MRHRRPREIFSPRPETFAGLVALSPYMRRPALAFLAVLAVSCIEIDPPDRRHPAPDAAPAPAGATFEVRVQPPALAARGTPTSMQVSVVPTAPWHLNLDFPVKLKLRGTAGVRLPSPSLRTADATRYDENALVFDVPVTVDGCGEQSIDGEVDFAVCDDGSCAPSSEPVAMSLAAC